MRLSLFDNDNNLGDGISAGIGGSVSGTAGGQIGSSPTFPKGGISGGVSGQISGGQGRTVRIEIKGVVSNFYSWAYNERQWIKDALTARGWNIQSVDETNTPLGGVGTRTWIVTALVGKAYSDSDVVLNAKTHLQNRGMAVSSVRIVSASAVSYVGSNVDSSGGDGSMITGVNASIAGLAVGLGISTTMLLAGGAVVLVLLLRRR